MTRNKDRLTYISGDVTSDRSCLETSESVGYLHLGTRAKMSKMTSSGSDVIRDCLFFLLTLEVISIKAINERARETERRPQNPNFFLEINIDFTILRLSELNFCLVKYVIFIYKYIVILLHCF